MIYLSDGFLSCDACPAINATRDYLHGFTVTTLCPLCREKIAASENKRRLRHTAERAIDGCREQADSRGVM